MKPRTLRACLVVVASAASIVGSGVQPRAQATAPGAEALFKDLRWRNIGPANMSGRVSDIDAVEANPAIVYVAAASGGVWKSVNAGTTWEPIFTQYNSASIGDVTIYQRDPNIVWVGTGEGCVRNSVAWGDGVYKSTDAGKTFTNVGLAETHHIGRIATHPTNPDIVYVAAQGHLWGHNPERGIFKTIDGGKSWRRLTSGLPDDGRTGASDIAIDPSNPNVLYAGMWERIRRPYVFESGGPNGGIYKSTNGGESWTKLTNGLPAGNIGKVILSIYRRSPKTLIAMVEAARSNDLKVPGSGLYRSEDAGATWTYISNRNDRPFYYSHVYIDPSDPNRVYALAALASVSDDGGRTFRQGLPGIEGDFHALWIDPSNSNRFYVGNDKGASVTYDRGLAFQMFDNMDIGQFYAVTADNRDPYFVYGGLQDSGNWGGPSNSRDYNGILNDHWFKFHSGDGFHTTVDPDDWRTVYTESQNGGIRRMDATFRQMGKSIRPTPQSILNFEEVASRAGGAPAFRYNWSAPIALSPHDSKTVYLGSNYLFKSADRGESWTIVSPDLSTNDPIFTAQADPNLMGERGGAESYATIISVVESPVTPGVIWAGTDDGNVQVTRDGGRSWTNARDTLPASSVPARTWVSRVEPSHFEAGTAYVSFDGHRSNDFKPYVYRATDFGRTWTNVTANIPSREPVYVVKEDLKNPNLLFAGTEFGVYASFDRGGSWHRIMNGFPTVAVHDLVIHPRTGDLIAATHGRSIWILDDITPLQQLSPAVASADAHLFGAPVATIWRGISRGATRGHFLFQGRNPLTIAQRPPANSPSELANSAAINFYLGGGAAGTARIEIESPDGARRFSADLPATPGITRYMWNMRFGAAAGAGGGRGGRGGGRAGAPGGRAGAAGARGGGAGAGAGEPADMAPPLPPQAGSNAVEPGVYRVKLTVNGRTLVSTLTIRDDPAIR